MPHRLELVSGSGSDDENPARRRLSPTGLALIGWTGGLALGVLGLLPVVTQHGFGSTTYVSLADHFVYAFQLLLAGWGTGPSIPGPGDTLTFSLGIVAFGLAVLGIVLFREGARRRTSTGDDTLTPTSDTPTRSFALAVVLILAALSTTLAAFFWQGLPFLARTLTYPWQLLLLAGPWLAWLAGLGGRVLLDLWPEEARRRWTVPLFAGLLTMTLLGAYGVLNPTTTSVPVPDAPVAIFGDNQIALLSAEPVGSPMPGGQIKLLTRWQALRPLDQDYTVFFHAMGPDGKPLGPARHHAPERQAAHQQLAARPDHRRISISSPWRQTRQSAVTTVICWDCISGRQARASPRVRTTRLY